MRILTVALPQVGGSGTVAFRLARHLATKEGFESHFLSYDTQFHAKSDRAKEMTIDTAPIFQGQQFPHPLTETSLTEHIIKYCIEKNIDIIHAHFGVLCGHTALFASKILKEMNSPVRLVTTFHGTDVIGSDVRSHGKEVFRHLNGALLRDSDAVSFVSTSLRESAIEIYGTQRNGMHIIPNAIDIEFFTPSISPPKDSRLIHISNFREVKQAPMVIDIFGQVLQKHPDASLCVIGDGPELETTRKRSVALGVQSALSFTGSVSEQKIVQCLQQSKALILPSLYESFSLVALEALSCGVPVVASAVGGIGEVIQDGETGCLVQNPNDIDTFANHTNELLSDMTRWSQYSNRARRQALRFSEDRVYKKYIDVYKQLLQ